MKLKTNRYSIEVMETSANTWYAECSGEEVEVSTTDRSYRHYYEALFPHQRHTYNEYRYTRSEYGDWIKLLVGSEGPYTMCSQWIHDVLDVLLERTVIKMIVE